MCVRVCVSHFRLFAGSGHRAAPLTHNWKPIVRGWPIANKLGRSFAADRPKSNCNRPVRLVSVFSLSLGRLVLQSRLHVLTNRREREKNNYPKRKCKTHPTGQAKRRLERERELERKHKGATGSGRAKRIRQSLANK